MDGLFYHFLRLLLRVLRVFFGVRFHIVPFFYNSDPRSLTPDFVGGYFVLTLVFLEYFEKIIGNNTI